MPLLKAHKSNSDANSPLVMNLASLENEGERIIARARAEADRILAEARARAEAEAKVVRDQSREAGFAEGHAQGLQEGQKQGHDEALAMVSQTLQDLAARWSRTIDNLEVQMPTHAADAKIDLVKLALAIAGKVTHQTALVEKAVVTATVEESLKLISAGRSVTLFISPAELQVIETYLPDMLVRLKTAGEVKILTDEAISPGGCRLELGSGVVDATLETQAARIAEELLGQAQ